MPGAAVPSAPAGAVPAAATEADEGAPAGDALAAGWSRVVDEVMKKRALLGTVLQHASPTGLAGGVLSVSVTGTHFHKEMLADRVNRDLINQAIQLHVPGASRMEVDANGAAQSGARKHPAVEAAVDAFQGEIVAVRPRRQGEGEAT
jgi:hypothetical protein